MDKRRKYFLVVDVETANSTEQALTYDIGFAVCDKQGRVYESRSYAVSDIFFDEKKIYHLIWFYLTERLLKNKAGIVTKVLNFRVCIFLQCRCQF